MLSIVISMVVIVALAALVVTFVAFPHRGQDVPGASWLGQSMTKAVDVLPTLDNTADDARRDAGDDDGGAQPEERPEVGGERRTA